jgi:hypothetical protein
MYFLSHGYLRASALASFGFCNFHVKVALSLSNGMRPATIFRLETLDSWGFVNPGTGDVELGDISLLLLSIGNGTLKYRLDVPGTATLGEFQSGERLINGYAADGIDIESRLSGSDSSETM